MLSRNLSYLLASLCTFLVCGASAAAATCASMSQLKLPNTTITAAESYAAGKFTPPVQAISRRQPAVPVDFCRVTGVIKPTPDSNIKFELWMPAAGWTGRYESVGNGGFAGSIRYDSMIRPLIGGSAVASTDDGHSGPAVGPNSASWALGHPQKIIDYGYRAVHLTAEDAKKITTAFYGRRPRHSYFVGCSKGGQEGLMEAQRYPGDFDGIVSGAAANQWTDLFSSFSWGAKLNLANRAGYIAPQDLEKIGTAVAAACDAADGVKDGLISDPLHCRVDPSTIGLTAAQLKTYESIHDGPKTASGRHVYAGLPYGGETVQWNRTVTGPSFEQAPVDAEESMYGNGFFANFVYQAPNWTFRSFDIDKTPDEARNKVGQFLNADDVHFSKFKARHGKIVAFHGWADSIVTPLGAISYYNRVMAAQSSSEARALEETQRFFRLFLAPGVGHCAGGPGPNEFGQRGGDGDAEHDIVVALEQWVEKDIQPERIVATKFEGDDHSKAAVMTRPLCAFPAIAKYRGKGGTDAAANFVCAAD
ncbi:MAG TPA: tannase/feruloyl esterase family alpha/beta hydrolase [Steroidobacteraceae bacterium]|jgi:feruloyl esterase|nr:tannase/feruloyl esterase family alpha/beta hydrolase [Steroidobacteraceae bacterium]